MRPLHLFVLCSALSLVACSPSDPRQSASASLANDVLLPAYQAWASASAQLPVSAQALCATQQPADNALPQARQDLQTAQRSWAALQPLQLGPLSEGNRAWQVQFWPDKKNLVRRQVENLIDQHPALSRAQLERASVVVQGLSAYEYLLFDSQLDLARPADRQRYCALLGHIAGHQQQLSAQILAELQGEQGFLKQLQQFPNTRFAEADEALAELLRAQVNGLDLLKKKLGTAIGKLSKGIPQPLQAEFWRSQASLDSLAAAVHSAEQLWQGQADQGIASLLDDTQQPLRQRIDQAYADTRQQLAALQQPLDKLLSNDAGRAQLDALYVSLDRLHRLQERDLAGALGIQLGFNAHDGD
jgi:predicted lipoprotein